MPFNGLILECEISEQKFNDEIHKILIDDAKKQAKTECIVFGLIMLVVLILSFWSHQ